MRAMEEAPRDPAYGKTDPARAEFFKDLIRERARQDAKFASVRVQRPELNRWDRLAYYLKFIAEEVGEVADATEKAEGAWCASCSGGRASATCADCGNGGRKQATGPYEDIRKELVEVAALCLRTIEDEGL